MYSCLLRMITIKFTFNSIFHFRQLGLSNSFHEVVIPKLDDLPPLGPPPRLVYPAVMVVRRLSDSYEQSDVVSYITSSCVLLLDI